MPVSSQISIAGSCATAWVRASNEPGSESAEELVLVVHEVGVTDLLVRGGELLAHEKDELLPKGRVGHDHPVEPPGRELDELLVIVVVVTGDARLRDRRQVRALEGIAGSVASPSDPPAAFRPWRRSRPLPRHLSPRASPRSRHAGRGGRARSHWRRTSWQIYITISGYVTTESGNPGDGSDQGASQLRLRARKV